MAAIGVTQELGPAYPVNIEISGNCPMYRPRPLKIEFNYILLVLFHLLHSFKLSFKIYKRQRLSFSLLQRTFTKNKKTKYNKIYQPKKTYHKLQN